MNMDRSSWVSSCVFSPRSKNRPWNDHLIIQVLLYRGGCQIDSINETWCWCEDAKQNKTTDDCGVHTLLLSTHHWLLAIILFVYNPWQSQSLCFQYTHNSHYFKFCDIKFGIQGVLLICGQLRPEQCHLKWTPFKLEISAYNDKYCKNGIIRTRVVCITF
jgi:hypothetical protein